MLSETMYRIALQHLPQYTPSLIKHLIGEYGDATNIFLHASKYIHNLRKRSKFLPKPMITDSILEIVEKEVQWMNDNSISLCFYADEFYPKRMKNCSDAPYMFYYKGNSDFNSRKIISIVGTRNASQYGKDMVKRLISDLASYNITVVSGLAEGVDTAAHEQALCNNLNTIAVLGSGLGIIYPYSNRKLSENIVSSGGTLISEYSFNIKPERGNFPRRNRIIAGLSDATIVIETALKGGSIITAHIANSYNRDVFAIPGSVFEHTSSGCNELIRNNIAALLTSGEELVEMMGWKDEPLKRVQRSLFVELSPDEKGVVDFIQKSGEISIDEINIHCQSFTPSQIAGILLGLELKGVVECMPGKRYRLG